MENQSQTRKPHSPAVLASTLIEANRLYRLGEDKRARILLQDIVDRHPDEVAPQLMLTELDAREGKLLTARRRLEPLVRRHPNLRVVRMAFADIAEELGDLASAISIYRQDIDGNPADAVSHFRLAGASRIAGRLDEARDLFLSAIDKWPDLAGGYVGLVSIDASLVTDDQLDRMRQLAAAPTVGWEERALLQFALGEVLDRRKAFDNAFEAFGAGNALRRENLGAPRGDSSSIRFGAPERTTIKEAEDLQSQVTGEAQAMFTREYLAHFGGRGLPSKAPIFIVGMPRSGSTLLEQILSSHPDVTGLGETRALANSIRTTTPATRAQMTEAFKQTFYRRLGETYLAALGEYGWDGKSRVIDKMLGNFTNIGFIHLALPGAVIVNSMRDPVDTCFSCFRQTFKNRNEMTYDLGAVGRQYVLYRSIMAHWDRVLPGRVLHVQHEAILTDPETEVRKLVAACGLPWNDACLRFYEADRPVRTASASQVRRPLFKSSVARWKPYEKHLAPLFEALGPYAPEEWRSKTGGGQQSVP